MSPRASSLFNLIVLSILISTDSHWTIICISCMDVKNLFLAHLLSFYPLASNPGQYLSRRLGQRFGQRFGQCLGQRQALNKNSIHHQLKLIEANTQHKILAYKSVWITLTSQGWGAQLKVINHHHRRLQPVTVTPMLIRYVNNIMM